MDATHTLAQFIHDLTPADLSPAAIRMAELLALDTVGAALAGFDARGIAALTQVSAATTRGTARVWVTGERVSAPAATLVNSSMAHALEFDDLHRELPMHSGIIVIPVALAMAAENPDLTGADLVTAIVGGTEIICRMARATRSYRGTKGFRGWNPTGVVAGFAASAMAGKLLGLDADGIARAMGLSYAQASSNQQCIEDGGVVKRMQPGMVAEAGVRAALLARAGITGAIHAIEGRNGFYNVYEGGEYDADRLTDGLGATFEIEKVAFKRYPVCGMAQPAMDCLRDLQMRHGFAPDQVRAVRAYGSKFVSDMVGRRYVPGPNPEVDAQFNLSFCLATILQSGDFTLADLADSSTLNPERRALADTISVTLDPALTGKWQARIEVELTDGTIDSATRKVAAWQDDRPMTEQELLAKYRVAAEGVAAILPKARTMALADALMGLSVLPDAAAVLDNISR